MTAANSDRQVPEGIPQRGLPLFDMWALIPAAKGAQNGWSLVASGVMFEEAMVYKNTFLFEVTFQLHQVA